MIDRIGKGLVKKLGRIEHLKTMHTLKILMRLTAIGFHFDRLANKYNEPPKSHEVQIMLMQRCIKLFNTVEFLSVAFKLLRKKLVISVKG